MDVSNAPATLAEEDAACHLGKIPPPFSATCLTASTYCVSPGNLASFFATLFSKRLITTRILRPDSRRPCFDRVSLAFFELSIDLQQRTGGRGRVTGSDLLDWRSRRNKQRGRNGLLCIGYVDRKNVHCVSGHRFHAVVASEEKNTIWTLRAFRAIYAPARTRPWTLSPPIRTIFSCLHLSNIFLWVIWSQRTLCGEGQAPLLILLCDPRIY